MVGEELGKKTRIQGTTKASVTFLGVCPPVWPGFYFFISLCNQLALTQKAAQKLGVQLSAGKKSAKRRFLFLVQESEKIFFFSDSFKGQRGGKLTIIFHSLQSQPPGNLIVGDRSHCRYLKFWGRKIILFNQRSNGPKIMGQMSVAFFSVFQ